MKEKNTTFTRKILLLVTSLILVTTNRVNGISRANNTNTVITFGICHDQLDGKVFPISNRSNEYIYCLSQEDIRLNCSMGKVFNTAANGCISKNYEEYTYCDLYPNGIYQCPYDCHTFIICRDGAMKVGNCPGDTIFNPTSKLCDTPDDVVCQSPLSSESPSTTTESTINICTNQPNNALLPYASNCAMFIHCLNGDPQIVECPYGTLFDPDLLICYNANNVICSETTAGSIIDTTSTTPIAYENYCFDQSAGETFPYCEDCQKYYYCWGDNTSSVLPCPANNWYNPITGRCGPEVSPNACQIPKITTTATTTTQRTILSLEELCMNADMGTLYPMSSDCQQYIICTDNGDSMILKCPNKNWFNPETGKCGPNVSPTACQEIINNETTTSTTILTASNDIGICYNKDYGEVVSYPNDCQKYVICATPVPVAFYCQNGYYFNAAHQECVLLAESDCKTTTTTTTTTTTPPWTTEIPTICTNAALTNFPYIENCQWYYHCINDYVYMMALCNASEYFDPLTGECSNEVLSNTCKEDYQNSNQKHNNILVSITSGPCGNKPVGFKVPYPYDCTKFIQCNTFFPSILDCREGLEFNREQQRCMAPNLANCSKPNLISSLTSSTDVPPTTTYDQDMPSPTKSFRITTCEHLPDYSTLPYTSNCSRYIICLKGNSSIANCTFNSYYNIEEGSCNQYTSPYACYQNYDSTTNSSRSLITTSTTTTIIPPTNSNICCGHSMGSHIPYPNDYTKYIVCAYPIPYTITCANGTFYDENTLECVGPSDNDGDRNRNGNGQNSSLTGSMVKVIDTGNSCSNVLYGTPIEYKGNCSLYVLCFGNKGVLLLCNNNWYFYPKMRQCVPPSMYQCPW